MGPVTQPVVGDEDRRDGVGAALRRRLLGHVRQHELPQFADELGQLFRTQMHDVGLVADAIPGQIDPLPAQIGAKQSQEVDTKDVL